jgi:hypothetical protein
MKTGVKNKQNNNDVQLSCLKIGGFSLILRKGSCIHSSSCEHTVHTVYNVNTVHTVHSVHTVHTVHCTYCSYCTHCAYGTYCTHCAVSTILYSIYR